MSKCSSATKSRTTRNERSASDRRSFLKMSAAAAAFGFAGWSDTTLGGDAVKTSGTPADTQAGPLRAPLSRHVDSGYVPGLVAATWHKGDTQVLVLGRQSFGGPPMREKLDRLVTQYRPDPTRGELAVMDEPHGLFSRPPVFESGGGGLVSTVDDYLAYSRMLLGKGELDGRRVLSPVSVAEMTRNQLTAEERRGPHASLFFGEHSGWGLGMAVAVERDEPWRNPGRFGWDGGYGTSAYADPGEGLAGVLLTQRLMDSPAPPPTYTDFWTAASAIPAQGRRPSIPAKVIKRPDHAQRT